MASLSPGPARRISNILFRHHVDAYHYITLYTPSRLLSSNSVVCSVILAGRVSSDVLTCPEPIPAGGVLAGGANSVPRAPAAMCGPPPGLHSRLASYAA